MGEGGKNIDKVITDLALEDPAHDIFGRDKFAKRVADILINKQTPDHLTVGIYGKWGEGKTTLINFVKCYLEVEHKEQAIHIDFNPWRYKDEEQLMNSFFKQFAQGITHKLEEQGNKIAKTILAYSGLIVAIAEPVTGMTMFSSLGGIDRIKKSLEKIKNFVTDNDFSPAINSLEKSLKDSESLEKQKQRISKQLEKTGKKYIVFIDDIDRLDSREIQILFSLIKVTADFDNVIYVLSLDPDIVSQALEETYPGSGMKFLQKIIQVPLHLPKARKTDIYNELLYPGINTVLSSYEFALTSDEEREITDSISNGLESRINTPRMVKRYLNALNFALPILKGETNVHDVIMIEGLRICYPDTYEFVFNHRELFISEDELFDPEEWEEKEKHIVEEHLEDKDDSLRFLLKSLFLKLRDGSMIPIEEEPDPFQRIYSPQYFERYFRYSVPKDDLSDRSFNEFLKSLPTDDFEISVKKGKELLESSNEDVFLRKIEENEDKINEEISLNLILVLAGLGKNFSRRTDLINIRGPVSRVASIIIGQLKRVSHSKRFSLAIDTLKNCTNILLMAEIGRLLHNRSNKEPIFNGDEQRELEELVAKLIKEDAVKNGSFYFREEVKRDAPLLFNLWTYTPDEDEVEKYIIDSFEGKSSNVIEFLKAFTPTRGIIDGKIYYGLFEADQYTKVKRLVSPKIVYEILIKDYESVMQDSGGMNDLFFEGIIEEALAKSFAHYYKRDDEFKDNK